MRTIGKLVGLFTLAGTVGMGVAVAAERANVERTAVRLRSTDLPVQDRGQTTGRAVPFTPASLSQEHQKAVYPYVERADTADHFTKRVISK